MTEEQKREFYAYWTRTAKTQSWYLGHEVGEVEVLPCEDIYRKCHVYEPTRAWLWQVWTSRIEVLLYSQQLEIIGRLKKHIRLRVDFFLPSDVQIVKRARGWVQPSQEILKLVQAGDALAEMQARQIATDLWEVNDEEI